MMPNFEEADLSFLYIPAYIYICTYLYPSSYAIIDYPIDTYIATNNNLFFNCRWRQRKFDPP